MEAELVSLASSGATALVGLMVSDGWAQVKERVAALLARGARRGRTQAQQAGAEGPGASGGAEDHGESASVMVRAESVAGVEGRGASGGAEDQGESAGAVLPGQPAGATVRDESAGVTVHGESAGAVRAELVAGGDGRDESAGAVVRGEPAGAVGRGEPAGVMARGESAGVVVGVGPGGATVPGGLAGGAALAEPVGVMVRAELAGLEESREELLAARDAGDEDVAGDVEASLRTRLRRALRADPCLADELRALLAESAPPDAADAGGAVHNVISGGVQHGTVVQGRDFTGGLTFNG